MARFGAQPFGTGLFLRSAALPAACLEWPSCASVALPCAKTAFRRRRDLFTDKLLTEARGRFDDRSEEHTSELQSLMRISYAVLCLKKKQKNTQVYYTD